MKNKLDLALGVAIGSSIQIFLFVLPFLVVLAWGLDKPLTMNFDIFETVIGKLSSLRIAVQVFISIPPPTHNQLLWRLLSSTMPLPMDGLIGLKGA